MCNNNNIDEKFFEEEKKLADYIEATYPDAAIKLDAGAFLVKTFEKEDSVVIQEGNHILWNRKVTNHITEELEYTSDFSNDKYEFSYVYGGPEITMVLSSIVDKGLTRMKKGEKGNVYLSSRWLYKDFQPRIFYVDIVDVINNFHEYQETLMFGHLKKFCRHATIDTLKNVRSTDDNTKDNNVMYHIINEGKGSAITEGMNIETKTSISFLIRDKEILPYTVDQKQTWHVYRTNELTSSNCIGEILKKMKRGGKVVITMPSKLYWDDKNLPSPVNEYGQFYIPKWSVVVLTISIN